MKNKKLIFLFIFFIQKIALGTVQATLDAIVTTSKVFDTTTGTLFLGLADGASDKAISRINRFAGIGTPTVTGIATDGLLNNQSIEFLALSTEQCKRKPNLIAVTLNSNLFEQTKTIALSHDGKQVTESEELKDYNEEITSGIVELTASAEHIFTAVRPNSGNFGDTNSGITLTVLNPTTLEQTIKDATTGLDENKAQLFDKTSSFIKIGGDFTFTLLGTSNTNQSVTFHWDQPLQRLYIGVNVLSGAAAGTDGVRSVALASISSTGILTIDHFVPDDAFENNANNIIGLKTQNSYAFARNIKTMHTSTGPSYLIVNGSVGPGNNEPVHNIYALPLVDNPSSADHGKLASKSSAISKGKFTEIADDNFDLLDTTDSTDLAATLVGGSPLAIPEKCLPSDIVVIGDTVYASIQKEQQFDVGTPEDSSEAGIFYSQALFDQTGKIISWTPWSKRAFPFNAFANITDTAQKGKIFSFAVDALNGKIWAVDGSEKKYLASTSWTRGRADQPTSLIYKLNYILSDGCYSVLDLDQSTRGLAVSSPGRYALFGGKNKVVFTKTNKSLQTTTDFSVSAGAIPAPQTVIEDFSSDENFLETNLPSGAGAVIALEYSRRLAASGEQNYFFAGTQNGLYVFANNLKKGFTVDANVDDLNVAPFNGSWYKFDGIQGSVITIKTSGRGDDGDEQGALYVLTTQVGTTAQRPLISKIYKIPFDVNITDMETATVLLAESGIQETGSDLNSIKAIFDMELISTEINGNIKEQLVIATNQGLYRSTTAENTLSQDGIIDATDQEDAKWKPINTDDTSMYSALFGIDNAYNKTTIWPVQIADKKGANSFTRSSITQLNGTEISNDYLFVPEHFNATCQHKQFKTLLETTFFWSDGARRFFIVRPEQTGQGNRLLILPFNTADWFVNNPNTVLSDPSLNTACSFNWVQQIGASGQLIVGANNGVISLNGGGLIDLPFDAMV